MEFFLQAAFLGVYSIKKRPQHNKLAPVFFFYWVHRTLPAAADAYRPAAIC